MDVKPEIAVEIDSLVIEGYNRSQAERAGAALQSELQRLFSERGLPAGMQSESETLALEQPIELRPGLSPEKLGTLAAQALFARWE